ncbi:hypothetical protein D3C77_643890 [compost metagenome]
MLVFSQHPQRNRRTAGDSGFAHQTKLVPLRERLYIKVSFIPSALAVDLGRQPVSGALHLTVAPYNLYRRPVELEHAFLQMPFFNPSPDRMAGKTAIALVDERARIVLSPFRLGKLAHPRSGINSESRHR